MRRCLMTLKIALTAFVLAALPAASFALCPYSHQQAQSCAEGLVWDAESQSCVQQVSS